MLKPTLIMKPVGLSCNLYCKYCYNNYARNFDGKLVVMSEEVIARVADQFSQLPVPLVKFIWHGGEPLLAGQSFYEIVLEHQKLITERSVRIENSLQTNATLLDQTWINFFKANDFRIGISLDGPKHVHDAQRVDYAGVGSFDRVMRGLKLLQINGMKTGLVAVVTRSSLPYALEIYNFLKSEGVKSCDISPCAEVDPETGELLPFSITPTEYASFMRTVFDAWFKDDDPSFHIRMFNEIIQGTIEGCQRLCVFNQACHNYFAVDHDGSVYACGRFMGIEKMLLGNILTQSLAEILESQKYLQVAETVTSTKPDCVGCKWLNVCKGGCSYYRYLIGERLDSPNYFCVAYRDLFEYINSRVQPLLPA